MSGASDSLVDDFWLVVCLVHKGQYGVANICGITCRVVYETVGQKRAETGNTPLEWYSFNMPRFFENVNLWVFAGMGGQE